MMVFSGMGYIYRVRGLDNGRVHSGMNMLYYSVNPWINIILHFIFG